MPMPATWSVVLDRSFLPLRLGTSVMCIAHHLRMMKHTFSTQSNFRRIARLIFRNRVGYVARLLGTFRPVAQKVAVGCLHEQQQLRTYTGLSTRDVLVHDNGLTETRSTQAPATCHSAHVSLCDGKQLSW